MTIGLNELRAGIAALATILSVRSYCWLPVVLAAATFADTANARVMQVFLTWCPR